MPAKRPLRYDLPTAAPAPLRLVQLFVNTTDKEASRDLLAAPRDLERWFAGHGFITGAVGRASLRRTHELRRDLHELLIGGSAPPGLAAAAARARLTIDFRTPRLSPQAQGLDAALGALVATVYEAMRDGSIARLKTCRNCRYVFWDGSRNRSAAWCSMQLCGNRLKVRRHRARRARQVTPRTSRRPRGRGSR